MRACIHRGSQEIGGSCVELLSQGFRLILDIGLPLDAEPDDNVELPDIPALCDPEAGMAAVFISHGHPDHYGLLDLVHPDVPVFMGAAAHTILKEASFFTRGTPPREPTEPLRDRMPIEFGPFIVTPWLADHSGYDAYSFLVEADDRFLFYTGDVRGHGRKTGTFRRLLEAPPRPVHTLLMEGTHVRADAESPTSTLSESGVEKYCVELFERSRGMILACYSPQNIDRLVTLYEAATRAGREFVMDLYAATIAASIRRGTIPAPAWEGVRVYLPNRQRSLVIEAEAYERVAAFRSQRIYREEMQARSGELVFTFRQSMARELEKAACLDGAAALWAMWPGYLERGSGAELRRWLESREIPLEFIHASGHASVEDLQRLAEALQPDRVIPIHTSAPERFAELFRRVERHDDGEWWDV